MDGLQRNSLWFSLPRRTPVRFAACEHRSWRRLSLSVAVWSALTLTAMLASAAEIRVTSGGAPREALMALTPAFEKRTGHTVTYRFEVPTTRSLDAGEKTDMVVMPVPVIDAFVKTGKMRAEGRAVMGLIGSSVVVKQGAVQPDISTPDSFRNTLLNARSVVHSPAETPSGAHMAKVIAQLGMVDAMQKKTVHRAVLSGGVDLVATGEVEIGIYPTSAVIHVKGIALVGPLPFPLQNGTVYAAAVSADNALPEPALALIQYLADPANRTHWKQAGFDQPGD